MSRKLVAAVVARAVPPPSRKTEYTTPPAPPLSADAVQLTSGRLVGLGAATFVGTSGGGVVEDVALHGVAALALPAASTLRTA